MESTYYEVRHGHGVISKNGVNSFDTAEEATKMAVEFKENPSSHNKSMDESSISYWKRQTYSIVRVSIIKVELTTI